MSQYAREDIRRIEGYVPGEQPQQRQYIKLNTNENPYPPAMSIGATLTCFNWDELRLYPEPTAKMVREKAAEIYHVEPYQVLCGNGSDDLLTIAVRTFVGAGQHVAYTEPSYSLYPVLAALQGAIRKPVPLDEKYWLPPNAAELAERARLFLLARPNAPTGTSFPIELVEKLAREFKGVVWIDEAYADFADDNCLELVNKYDNVIVSRTFSKSFSLAGIRLGLAFGNVELIKDMLKLKDSYNVNMLTQYLAVSALESINRMKENAKKICTVREHFSRELTTLGFSVLPSQANFVFAQVPADVTAKTIFQDLRDAGILVRFFNVPSLDNYLRISIGTEAQMQTVVEAIKAILEKRRGQKQQ